MTLIESTPGGRAVCGWVVALLLLFVSGAAHAAPVLQVGAPAGSGDAGAYADYGGGTDPTEDDTAFTSGGTIYVAGLYQSDNIASLGGQSGSGLNWSSFGLPNVFDSHRAVLLVSVPDGFLAAAQAFLTVGGIFAFHGSEDQSYFPDNHDPLKDAIADFLFFDIGDFAKSVKVPEFGQETLGNKLGEIKELLIAGFGDLAWVHFDAMALQTSTNGSTAVTTTLQNNPGSHDVTWKPGDGPGPDLRIDIPEPGTLMLLGAGLVGAALWLRRRRAAA